MNNRQTIFCEEYIRNAGNGRQAALTAGYSELRALFTASDLLNRPEIRDYIKERQEALKEKLHISQEWVLQRLKDISDRCVQAEPVMVRNAEGDMTESGEYKFDSGGANKATELIGKHLGMFGDKLDVTSKGLPLGLINAVEIVHTAKTNDN